jgi:hypothetical protein
VRVTVGLRAIAPSLLALLLFLLLLLLLSLWDRRAARSRCSTWGSTCDCTQALLATPASRLFALVLAPTRELAFGIAEQFRALGTHIKLECAVIVGGVDMVTQAIALAKRPHVIIGTPGRVVDHLEHTKVGRASLASLALVSRQPTRWYVLLSYRDSVCEPSSSS